jgi:hypothetical protein
MPLGQKVAGCAGIALISLAAIAIFIALLSIPKRVEKQMNYAGLRLGATADEVLYIKGPPSKVGEMITEGFTVGSIMLTKIKDIPSGRKIKDYRYWDYDSLRRWNLPYSSHKLDLVFLADGNKRLTRVSYYSVGEFGECPDLEEITNGTGEETLLSRFGPPSSADLQGLAKIIECRDIGAIFFLQKQKVYVLGIYEPPYE